MGIPSSHGSLQSWLSFWDHLSCIQPISALVLVTHLYYIFLSFLDHTSSLTLDFFFFFGCGHASSLAKFLEPHVRNLYNMNCCPLQCQASITMRPHDFQPSFQFVTSFIQYVLHRPDYICFPKSSYILASTLSLRQNVKNIVKAQSLLYNPNPNQTRNSNPSCTRCPNYTAVTPVYIVDGPFSY